MIARFQFTARRRSTRTRRSVRRMKVTSADLSVVSHRSRSLSQSTNGKTRASAGVDAGGRISESRPEDPFRSSFADGDHSGCKRRTDPRDRRRQGRSEFRGRGTPAYSNLQLRLLKVGATIARHGCYVTFYIAASAVQMWTRLWAHLQKLHWQPLPNF